MKTSLKFLVRKLQVHCLETGKKSFTITGHFYHKPITFFIQYTLFFKHENWYKSGIIKSQI